ncbi:D-2-hydroxyacid dehydrogenase family protein [Gluconobacter kondonii]|uniref:D-2-hydroxyacid dehydrogenase family protein n=1 Tax=Gluconobacter kondonii TaxID=941463 RepID=UPI001B8AFE62|nr:D-2-hydroxyacid dehydrogenase family protein [Gluconobacter kondonii]MBS1081248.1 D-2-hydroxyacid dehydrogenase family protein [Gluconobacter kondonii]
MTRIAVLDDYQGVALESADWSAIQARAKVIVFKDHLDNPDALVARLLPFDAVCVMRERTPLTAQIIDRLPNLKFIGSNVPYNASIDLTATKQHGIVVSSTDGRGNGAPELTWALLLAAARQIPAEVGSFRSGGWQVGVGADLEGTTLGVMGLGKIGARVAAIGRAFGMKVIAWSENLTAETAQAAGATLVDKATLLREADWLTLHLVLSERSRGIIGAEELRLMKPTAWLVNTSRGPLVDETALIDALTRRIIAGAALDVYDVEPLPPEHKLRHLDNVVATSHVGFVTKGTYKVFYGETVENLLAWMDGSPIRVMT